MKLKHLESALQEVQPFREPNYMLEQYNTSPHLAARMLYTAASAYEDIEGCSVLDLGTGSGMLGIAAQLMGSSFTLGVDVDMKAIQLAQENALTMEVELELLQCDVTSMPLRHEGQGLLFDTVVMNPPFGTRVKGIDVLFLQQAVKLSTGAVYSMHKSSTREFLVNKAQEWGCEAEVLAQLRFDIPQMYKFHKKKSVDVEVDLIRFHRQ